MCCFKASYLNVDANEAMVRLEDLIRIIFQELDSVQLQAMWNADGETQASMIEIIYALCLVKTRL